MKPPNQPSREDESRLPPALPSRSPGSELITIALLTLVAAGLRLVFWNNVAIEHFDEGVYAANFYAGRLDDQFPDRHLYAPPLLPLLIEYSIVLGGGLHAAMWINLVTGVLLVPALWWVGRSWFGPIAGLTAAALCTFSDVHLLYSRTALTDPLLTFFLVLAVYAIWCAICQGGALVMVGSALLVSCAWWTKYNGWLPLAIAASGFIGWLKWGIHPPSFEDDAPALRSERRHPGPTGSRLSLKELLKVLVPRLVIVIVLSIAAWIPFVFMLQDRGGYASVAANHSRYVGGIINWLPALWTQARNLLLLEGLITSLGIVGVAALLIRQGALKWNRNTSLLIAACLLAALAVTAWLGSAFILLMVGIWGASQVFVARKSPRDEVGKGPDPRRSSESNLAGWMLAAWFIGLLLATPLYHPYSRLTLPWLAAGWLMFGMSAAIVMRRLCVSTIATAWPKVDEKWVWSAIALSSAILIWQGPNVISHGVSGWSDRTGMQQIAPRLIEAAIEADPTHGDNSPETVDAVFYVLAEPALFVHLSSLSVDSELNYVAQPASSLIVAQLPEDPGFRVYLVVGPHMLADASALAEIANITLLDVLAYTPSDLVWLDEFPGRSMTEEDSDDARWQVRLYEVSPE